jgi:hypothetical protein
MLTNPPPLGVTFFGIALQSCKRVNLFSNRGLFGYTAQYDVSDPDHNPPFSACLIPVRLRKNSVPIEPHHCISAFTERMSSFLKFAEKSITRIHGLTR